MNTRARNYTEQLEQEFAAVRSFYAQRGISVTSLRKLNYAGKYRIETGAHGWYATFKHDEDGKIVGDVQTIN